MQDRRDAGEEGRRAEWTGEMQERHFFGVFSQLTERRFSLRITDMKRMLALKEIQLNCNMYSPVFKALWERWEVGRGGGGGEGANGLQKRLAAGGCAWRLRGRQRGRQRWRQQWRQQGWLRWRLRWRQRWRLRQRVGPNSTGLRTPTKIDSDYFRKLMHLFIFFLVKVLWKSSL